MNQQTKTPQPKPGHKTHTLPDAVIKQKQMAEQREVAGRHKNDGAKHHKGAR